MARSGGHRGTDPRDYLAYLDAAQRVLIILLAIG
jgi:hypothetical protein